MRHATRFIIMAAFLLSGLQSMAQENPAKQAWEQQKEQFKADKVAFITTKMNFSVEEAQDFWPIYNKYDAIFDQIADERRHNYDPRRCKPICQISDEACRKMMDNAFALDRRELDARKQMYDDLTRRFSPNQVLRYYNAEFEFRRHVVAGNAPKGGSFGKSFKND